MTKSVFVVGIGWVMLNGLIFARLLLAWVEVTVDCVVVVVVVAECFGSLPDDWAARSAALVMEAVALGSGLRFSGVCELLTPRTDQNAGPAFSFPEFLSGWSLVGWAPLSRVSLFDWPGLVRLCWLVLWCRLREDRDRIEADSAMTTNSTQQMDKTTMTTATTTSSTIPMKCTLATELLRRSCSKAVVLATNAPSLFLVDHLDPNHVASSLKIHTYFGIGIHALIQNP